MVPTDTTVWPNDVVFDPQELSRKSPHSLVCFLLCPFNPQADFDQVHAAVKFACELCLVTTGIEIECRRADTLYVSKTIHDDIWHHIAAADFLIVDVTGLNANVMYEYGVAAAIRRPYQVIAIKSKDDESRHPFDVGPLRYLTYSRSVTGDRDFIENLGRSMLQAVTPAPYVPWSAKADVNGFSTIDLRNGDRRDVILSPGITHRRLAEDGLEFGSYYVFRNSWLLLTQATYHHVRARVRFRFLDILKESEPGYLGVSLRNQHILANWGGHMVWLQTDGRVMRTEPKDDRGDYQNVEVDLLPGFDYRKPDFVDLTVEINEDRLAFSVGNMTQHEVLVKDMPYVYGAGNIRVTTWKCRVRIQEIELTPL